MTRGFPIKYPSGQNWDHLLVGVNYADDGNYTKISVDPGETVDDQFHYCPNEPNYFRNTEYCHFMYTSDKPDQAPFCMIDVNCNYKWRRYVCRKDKTKKQLDTTISANNMTPPPVTLPGPIQDGGACEKGWTAYNGSCYKHFDTPNNRGIFHVVRARCIALGGDIASGAKQHEREFMEKLNRPSLNGVYPHYTLDGDQLLIGINYLHDGKYTQVSVNPGETIDNQWLWCHESIVRVGGVTEPNYWKGGEFCHFMHSFPYPPYFCLADVNCNFNYRRYICRKNMPLVCKDKNAVAKDGKCVCKPGYLDITKTDGVEKKGHKEGEKCVSEDPCRSVKGSLAVVFIIDASQSIQERNWPSLVDFVKSASSLIPNQVSVGFIKFSTNVSFAEWLPIRWSKQEFQQMVPTKFDAGYTNTPAAIEKAMEMFDENGRKTDKVAVLITDGLPVVDEQTDKQTALDHTRQAISKLHRKGIDIVALGFGPELVQSQGDTYIKKWLEDPKEDYFSFDRMACDLRHVHMQILLQKVCRRYV